MVFIIILIRNIQYSDSVRKLKYLDLLFISLPLTSLHCYSLLYSYMKNQRLKIREQLRPKIVSHGADVVKWSFSTKIAIKSSCRARTSMNTHILDMLAFFTDETTRLLRLTSLTIVIVPIGPFSSPAVVSREGCRRNQPEEVGAHEERVDTRIRIGIADGAWPAPLRLAIVLSELVKEEGGAGFFLLVVFPRFILRSVGHC